jgi:hypothetical protein
MAIDIRSILRSLSLSEGSRALLCMLPVLVAGIRGNSAAIVALGQGGFFFSSLFLPARIWGRFIMSMIVITLGLGLYLVGGNVVEHSWLGIFVTLLVSLSLSFLSGWRIGGPVALSLVMVYTSGLNTGSPEKASKNFLFFMIVMVWSMLISMLPIWRPFPPPKPNVDAADAEYAEQGLRMGIGSAIALGISYLFGFAKLGWAPSAVGNIVRFDRKLTRARAYARTIGTIVGAGMAIIALGFIQNPITVVYIGTVFGVLNGLFKPTVLGRMPLFYTATILLLYSANDLAGGTETALQRVAYNLIGILIGLAVVIYPFPYLFRRLRSPAAAQHPG